MLEFARWKYVVIAVVLLFTTLYSIPNLYPKDPAVQVTANRGAALDAALESRVVALLKANAIATGTFEAFWAGFYAARTGEEA
jgi:preprotein translocase subunit SecD